MDSQSISSDHARRPPKHGYHVLCTGGAGYIGSHTVVKLREIGFRVSILDNFCNSSERMIARINEIVDETQSCGWPSSGSPQDDPQPASAPGQTPGLSRPEMEAFKIDLTNRHAVFDLFKNHTFDAVIHYAGLKAVGESVTKPLDYYYNNLTGTINLLQAMGEFGCKTIVFSSSATVYRENSDRKLTERDELNPINPYGFTKSMVEQVLKDVHTADESWKISILRYFNPIGAHPSGRIGEAPAEPTNLLPIIQQVAVKRRDQLVVFGDDWPTPDGTGVRDYLHVEDLAIGHIAALCHLEANPPQYIVHNLGTGKGSSVLQMKDAFERACGSPIPFSIGPRRPGDLASVVADPSMAEKELHWTARLSIDDACQSAWKWQSSHPYGLNDPSSHGSPTSSRSQASSSSPTGTQSPSSSPSDLAAESSATPEAAPSSISMTSGSSVDSSAAPVTTVGA